MSFDATRIERNKEAAVRDYLARPERPRWELWVWGSVLALLVIVVTGLISPYVRHEWGLSLRRESTTYTELGFTDASALPARAVRGRVLRVSFEVTNDGARPISYRYVISSGVGRQLVVLSSETSSVAGGKTWEVNNWVAPKCPQASCKVQVALPQVNEQIYFILTLTQPRSDGTTSKRN
jgi:hypothetical protein